MSKNQKSVENSVVDHAVYDTFFALAKEAEAKPARRRGIEYQPEQKRAPVRRPVFIHFLGRADQALIPLQSFIYCLIAGMSVYLFAPSVVGMTRVGTLTISSFCARSGWSSA